MTNDLKSYVKQKSFEYQALQEEANHLNLPDDVPSLIASWLKDAESLPDELPQKTYIKRFLNVALKDFHAGDIEAARLFILKAMHDFENAKHDIWVLGVQKQFGQNAERQRKANDETVRPKHDKWQKKADEIKLEKPDIKVNKSELARRIKKYFDDHDPNNSGAERTIRRIIE